MSFFIGLNEKQIMAKLLDFEKTDGFSIDESKAYISHKCSNEGKSVVVVGFLEYDFNYRKAEYEENIMRYWLVMDENGTCLSEHVRYRAAKRTIGIVPKPKKYDSQLIDEEAMAICLKVRANEVYQADRDNCVPTAISIASGIPYDVVSTKAKEFGFNPNGGGMKGFQINRLMRALDIKFEICTKEIREVAKTTKSFNKKGINGRYVVSIDGHCLPCVNGMVCDTSWNENRRIQTIRKIIS